MNLTNQYNVLAGAVREDHHTNGDIRSAFATVARDINPAFSVETATKINFTPDMNGPGGIA